MKKIVIALTLNVLAATLASVPAYASANASSDELSQPQFVSLKADQPAYVIGAHAVLTAYVQVLPSNPNYEIYLAARLGGQAIQVTRISETQAASVSPVLAAAGVQSWDVEVYLQNRQLAHDLNATQAFYSEEICALNDQLKTETDPAKIAMIEKQILRDQGIIATAASQLGNHRRLIESDHLTVTVNARKSLVAALDNPVSPAFEIRTDHDFSEYRVGERASFFVHVNTAFQGEDGPRENVVRSAIAGIPAGVTPLGPIDFSSITQIFAASDVGTHQYAATLLTRSIAQANSLRDGITQAETRRLGLIHARDLSQDPQEKALLNQQIGDLLQVVSAFYQQLDDSLLSVGTVQKEYRVTVSL